MKEIQLVCVIVQAIAFIIQVWYLKRAKQILKESDELMKDVNLLLKAEDMRHRKSFTDWSGSWLNS